MAKPKLYVLGFCFSADSKDVLLIQKKKPDWMKGMWNGLGGKVEPYEDHRDAMSREFYEEGGVWILPPMWERVASLLAHEETIECFRVWSDTGTYKGLKESDEGPLVAVSVDRISKINVVPNLRWLIPYALDANREGAPCRPITVVYDR